MKSSIYNIISVDDSCKTAFIYNTLYGSLATVSSEEVSAACELLTNVPTAEEGPATELMGSLVRGKFVIPDSVNELGIVRQRKYRGVYDNNRLDIVIMPNMACNFSCIYCYEKHDSTAIMDKSTEDAVITWLSGEVVKHKVVTLNWFGGEPTLSWNAVLKINQHINDVCRRQNIALLASVTTNGYAFNDTIIEKFIDAGLNNYQITVDGPERVHNNTRMLKNGGGSFSRVVNNMIRLARCGDAVRISLRVNYNHNNIQDIPELLLCLPEGIRYKIRPVFEPIFGGSSAGAPNNLSPETISRLIPEYYKYAKQLGYDVRGGEIGVGRLVYCFAERQHQYILSYSGEIFKCSVGDFSSKSRFGYINSDGCLVKDDARWDGWVGTWLFETKCEECVFLPLCMGGCKKHRIENMKNGAYCHLVTPNASQTLKRISYGDFNSLIMNEVGRIRKCKKQGQTVF